MFLTNIAVFLTDFRCIISILRINFAIELKTKILLEYYKDKIHEGIDI